MSKLIRVMIDLETLSTFPNAAMIAIGVVIRKDSTPKHLAARAWFIDRNFVVGHEDPATLEWWSQQDPVVRQQVFGGNQLPREVLQEVSGFLNSNGVSALNDENSRVYASPAMFDLPILRFQYQQMGITLPWHWRSERCLSTLKKEIHDNFSHRIADVEPELKHHPVHDCLAQFKELDECVSKMKNMTWGRG